MKKGENDEKLDDVDRGRVEPTNIDRGEIELARKNKFRVSNNHLLG